MDEDLVPLKEEEIKNKLEEVPGWTQNGNKIAKEFVFKDFTQAVEFVNQLVPFCNRIDHHPDICIYYNKIVFALTRFSVGEKITQRDFTVAQEIERLYKEMAID